MDHLVRYQVSVRHQLRLVVPKTEVTQTQTPTCPDTPDPDSQTGGEE